MAEFKLGRIRFVWKSDWAVGTTYFKDDIINYGGKTFLCVLGHTAAADFYTDLDVIPSKWNQFTDGQEWKGEWQALNLYKENDLVKYGGFVYICTNGHTSAIATSGLEADLDVNDSSLSKWELFAEGFEWRSDWSLAVYYRKNDIVKYGATNYVCNQPHQSAATTALGLENDLDKWDLLSEGFAWNGDWSTALRYKINDVVKYGGQSYVCNQGHTSAATNALGLEQDQSKWDYFHQGVDYKGVWSQPTRYKVNDLVKYGGGVWRCNTHHTSGINFNTGYFEQFVEGVEFEGVYTPGTVYQPGDIVRYGGFSYIGTTVNSNVLPTDISNWDLFATSFKFEGDWNSGTLYLPGQVIRHGGYTYTSILSGTNQSPDTATTYWSRLNSGLRWRNEWTNSTSYLLGDIVKFNSSSFVCVLAHTSDDDDSTLTPTTNSPEKDTTGIYWNLITSGLEDSVLTTVGDLVYYGPAGPARLPLGPEGAVLAVENGLPAWKFWGEISKVVYVGTHGEDQPYPLYGTSIDRPYASVRYATEQIEQGLYFADAKYLLNQNRTFIQKEITEWVVYQIANSIAPFAGFVNDSQALCERDIGLIVDAFIYDLTHTGNSKTIAATRSYFTALGVIEAFIADEEEQLVASINYAVSLIDKILSNLAPVANYQTLNGIGAGSRIKQIIDFNVTAETGSLPNITSLAVILTNALTTNSLASLPNEETPGFTINVKTGQYYEVLPILVPANTAVVGDELRSTRMSPAGKITGNNDKAKSVQTLQRLQAITSNVIQNVAVTVTAGNTAVQNTTGQLAGSVGSATAVASIEANITEIKDILANGLGSVDAFVLPSPTNWGTSLTNTAYASTGNVTGATTTYDFARAQILANTSFIKAEITAWIAVQVAGNIAPFTSSFTYDAAACARDVGYILDAARYDTTYGGNTQTRIAADAYHSYGVSTLGSGQKAPTLAAFARLKTVVGQVVTEAAVSVSAGNALTQDVSGTAGNTSSKNFTEERVQEIINTITADGVLATLIQPATSWVSAALLTARTVLNSLRATVQTDSVTYIKREFPTLNFNETTCSRDVGYIVDALGYDLMFGSNFASIKAGMAYRRGTSSALLLVAYQLAATLGIIDFIGHKAKLIAATGAATAADQLWTYLINYVNTGTKPITVGTNSPTTELSVINGARILELNKAFLVAEADAYIAATFQSTVSAVNAGTDTFTCGSQTWMTAGDTVRFTGTVFGGVAVNTTYYIIAAGLTATTFRISTSLGGTALDLSAGTGSMTVNWFYGNASCNNDVRNYIDAITYDLIYTGNYRSVLAARYYRNAYTGSKLEDMFYVRNGGGLRNATLTGLDGTSDGNTAGAGDADGLTVANEFGTQRPIAGSYVSLDPGWGPNDTRVWVTNKSTYVQNITTFGTACVGQKIDGSLHSGGNDSIVSNDFTQVLSDGIGAWITNLGRAELVSVFSYYAHIAYLAENGGKIRATNGNNSYGKFGSVSEGVDITETPLTAQIDNQGNEASIRNIITDGTQLLSIGYLNAGQNYNTATYTISGAGSGATISSIETRNLGVHSVRLTDPGDSTGPGGVNYATASNVAQAGNTTQITLAAADNALNGAYAGMHIFIISGTGAGQYGYINTYNNGSKVATVYKDSTGTAGWNHVISGTAISASLDLTTNYEISPRIAFTAPGYSTATSSLTARDYTASVYGNGYGSYTGLAVTGGVGSSATFDIIRVDGVYTAVINNPGFNYVSGNTLTILGTAVGGAAPANNITLTVVVVEDDGSGNILSVSVAGTAISNAFVALASGTGTAEYSVNGSTWSAVSMPAVADWTSVAYGNVANIGRYVAVAQGGSTAAYSLDGVNWTSSSLSEGGDWIDIAYGNNKFVAVSQSDSSTTTRAVSSDGGVTWSVGSFATGATAITFGNNRFVVVEGNFSNAAAYSTDGVTWTTAILPSNIDGSTESNWQDVTFGNGRFVAIADSAPGAAYSFNGATWFTATLPTNQDWRKITYGSGVFLALSNGETAASSEDGVSWTTRSSTVTTVSVTDTSKDDSTAWAAGTLSSSANWNAVGYGGSKYVAVSSLPINVAYSTNGGTTWTAGTIPLGSDDGRCVAYGGGVWVIPYAGSNDVATSSDGITFTFQSNVLTAARDWSSITYGNGYFVMVQSTGTNTAQYSTNGTSWSVGVLPSGDEWSSVAYGNIGGTNYFVAVTSPPSANSTVAASSTDNGATWTARTLPTSTRWSSVTFGNSRFVAVAGNSGTTTTSAAYSTNGTTWTASTLPGAAARWTNVRFNGSVFVATAYNSNRSAVSENGITWTEITMTTTANWIAGASDGTYNTVVVATGSTAVRTQFYEANTNYLTVASTAVLSVNDTVQFSSGVIGGIVSGTRYFVKSISGATRFNIAATVGGTAVTVTTSSGTMAGTVGKLYSAVAYGSPASNAGFVALSSGRRALNIYAGAQARGRAGFVAEGILREIWIYEPGSNYTSAPTMTITDPNNTGADATHQVRLGSKVLAQPNYTSRGSAYTAASATVVGDGFADNYQVGAFIEMKNISELPKGGENLQIVGIDDVFYRVVTVRNLVGVGPYTAQIQVSPNIGSLESPEHDTAVSMRRRYSQVRLTGHDFLDIGTGNQTLTNYPGLPYNDAIPGNETVESNGGRVFFTSTDQDGNFRVGGLFSIEQSTGTATLNADAFNLAGLNELSLGELALGGGGATIEEFSTDPFFTADSDTVIPTQRAIKAYISSQIGGGGSSLNVNSLTAGFIFIAGQEITTTTNVQININSKVNFKAGVDGYAVALNLFLNA